MASTYPSWSLDNRSYFEQIKRSGHRLYYKSNSSVPDADATWIKQVEIDGVLVYDWYEEPPEPEPEEFNPVVLSYPDQYNYSGSMTYQYWGKYKTIQYDYTNNNTYEVQHDFGPVSSSFNITLRFNASTHNATYCNISGVNCSINSTSWSTINGKPRFYISISSGTYYQYNSSSRVAGVEFYSVSGYFDFDSTNNTYNRLTNVTAAGHEIKGGDITSLTYWNESGTLYGHSYTPRPTTTSGSGALPEPTGSSQYTYACFDLSIPTDDINCLYCRDIRTTLGTNGSWETDPDSASHLRSETDPQNNNTKILWMDGSPNGLPVALSINPTQLSRFGDTSIDYIGAAHSHYVDLDIYIPQIPTWDASLDNPHNNGVWIRCWLYGSASNDGSAVWAGYDQFISGASSTEWEGSHHGTISSTGWTHLQFRTNGLGPANDTEWEPFSSMTFYIKKIRIAVWGWNGQSLPVGIKNLCIDGQGWLY